MAEKTTTQAPQRGDLTLTADKITSLNAHHASGGALASEPRVVRAAPQKRETFTASRPGHQLTRNLLEAQGCKW